MKKTIIAIIIFILVLSIVGLFIILNKSRDNEIDDSGSNDQGLFGGFFPFGNGSDNIDGPREPSPTSNGSSIGSLSQADASGLKLQQLTLNPIAGYIATSSNDSTSIRYIEKATGNIFDINTNSLNIGRVTNTTFPRLHDATWHNDSKSLILRYLDDDTDVIKTYAATLTDTGTSTPGDGLLKLEGQFLQNGIKDIESNPDNNQVLFTVNDNLGINSFIIDLEEQTILPSFESDFGEWKIQWINEDTLFITSKASYIANGISYKVSLNTNKLTKVLGPELGLTANANSDISKIVYSKTENGRFTTHLLDVDTQLVFDLEINTFAEKCVWSRLKNHILYCGATNNNYQGKFPDVWYQGRTTFNDQLWEIDADKLSTKQIANPITLLGVGIDTVDLSLTKDESLLLFKNKKDSTLWSLELPNIIDELYEDDEELDTEEVTEELPAS